MGFQVLISDLWMALILAVVVAYSFRKAHDFSNIKAIIVGVVSFVLILGLSAFIYIMTLYGTEWRY